MLRTITLLTILMLCSCNKITPVDVGVAVSSGSRTNFHINACPRTLYGEPGSQIKFNRVHDDASDSAESKISSRCQKDLLRLSTTPSL